MSYILHCRAPRPTAQIAQMQPKIYIRFLPNRPGSVCASFYVESDADLYGWHAEARGHRFSASFFMIENFYANRDAVLYRSLQDDVYGQWITDSPPAQNEIRCPLPEPVRHELERIQSKFVEEWLFFENDPAMSAEIAAYQRHGLPIQAVNVKSKKLSRLDRSETSLIHSTPHIDLYVIEFLQKHGRFHAKSMTG